MSSNPIKASDLYQDDGAITDAIKQLELLKQSYIDSLNAITKEAKELLASLQAVNTTTKEGQETTKKAATDAEKLIQAQKQQAKALDEVNTELREVKQQTRDSIKIQKLQKKATDSAEGSYNKLSAQYSLAKLKLNAMSKAERQATKSGRALEKQSKELYAEMNRLQKTTGKHQLQVGNYPKFFNSAKSALMGFVGVFGLVEGLRMGAKFLGDLKDLALQMEGDSRRAAIVFGDSLAFVTQEAAKNANQLGLTKREYVTAAAATQDLLIPLGFQRKEASKLSVELTNLSGVLSNWVGGQKDAREVSEILTKSILGETEQIKTLGIKIDQTSKGFNERVKLLMEMNNLTLEQAKALEILNQITAKSTDAQDEFNNSTKTLAQQEAIANALYREQAEILAKDLTPAYIGWINAKTAMATATGDLAVILGSEMSAWEKLGAVMGLAQPTGATTNMITAMGIRLENERKEIAEQAYKILLKTTDATAARALVDKLSTAQLNELIKAQTKVVEVEDKVIRNTTYLTAQIAKLKKEQDGLTIGQKGRSNEINRTIKAYEAEITAIKGVTNAKKGSTDPFAGDKLLAGAIGNDKDRELALFDITQKEKLKLWEKYNLDTTILTRRAAEQRQAIEDKYDIADAKKIRDRRKKDFSAGVTEIDQLADLKDSEIDLLKETEAEKTRLKLQAEKDRLQAILDLNKKIGGQLSELQIKQMQNAIKGIDQQMGKVGGDQKDIYSMLGLKLNDEQKQGIADATNFAIQNVQALLAARVEAADKALQVAQEETDSAQSRYDQEIEARNNGYANDVITKQKELELAKKTEAKAQKQKEKALKAQELLDTAMQTSSLITASANIWKSLSSIPVIGTALAVAALATMWGSFAASKIKAKSVSKEKYGEGGLEVLSGGSHASGNDIPIGTTASGKQRTAEGGEALAIIKKSSTKKYKGVLPGLIDSLNKGTFEKTYSNAFIPGDNMPPIVFNTGYDSPDLKAIEDDLGAIRERGAVQRYLDSDGRLVEVYKNVKRIYV